VAIDHHDPSAWAHIDPTPLQRWIRRIVTRPGRWWLRYRGSGHEPRVPAEGGFILAPAPHGAYADPLIYALGQPRTRLRFMAKYEVLDWWLVGRIVRWGGGFPVHRGGGASSTALDVARAVIESGDGVVVFMEGRLELSHEGLGTPRSGVARLALATGAPVVPVAAYGAKRARAYGKRWWRHRPKVTAVWGEPLVFDRDDAPTPERVDAVRTEIWEAITKCFATARDLARTR
jgi:1-acyl-sn-glycerol-3-phosphate acyltransferase